MRTTIDKTGRVLVPKALRVELGLVAGQPLEIEARDGRLELEPAVTEVTLERRDGHLVAVPAEPLPVLTAEMVRDVLEQTRR